MFDVYLLIISVIRYFRAIGCLNKNTNDHDTKFNSFSILYMLINMPYNDSSIIDMNDYIKEQNDIEPIRSSYIHHISEGDYHIMILNRLIFFDQINVRNMVDYYYISSNIIQNITMMYSNHHFIMIQKIIHL